MDRIKQNLLDQYKFLGSELFYAQNELNKGDDLILDDFNYWKQKVFQYDLQYRLLRKILMER